MTESVRDPAPAGGQRRPGRPRAGERGLSRERIVECAIALVDSEGMPALTMRRLATELRVDPMAIYHHVPNKRALVRAMVAQVFGELASAVSSAAEGDWQTRVRRFADAYLAAARAHPGLVLHLVADAGADTDETLAVTESLYAALAAAGLEATAVVHTADLIIDWTNGVALAGSAVTFGPGDRTGMRLAIQQRSENELPVLRRVYAEVDPAFEGVDPDAALDTIIAGIEARFVTTAPKRRSGRG